MHGHTSDFQLKFDGGQVLCLIGTTITPSLVWLKHWKKGRYMWPPSVGTSTS